MTDLARITKERDDLQDYIVRLATLHPPLPNGMVETQVPVDPVIVQLAERLVAVEERAEKAEREILDAQSDADNARAKATSYRAGRDQALEQLAALRASHAWQPIETAPDDTCVLLCHAPTGEIRTATRMTSMEDGDAAWVIARHLSSTSPIAFVFRDTTHWMPLPSPPTGEQKP